MTFNPNADISGGGGNRRTGSGGGKGIAIAGGGVGVIVLFVISQFLGVDLTGLANGAGGQSGGAQQVNASTDNALSQCRTGEDANNHIECRMKGAAAVIKTYWDYEGSVDGVSYPAPSGPVLFDRYVRTSCGDATASSGPFYCPTDQTIYLDVRFFDELRGSLGATGGALAEMYVIAHEWGHHIQNLSGILEKAQDGDTGPTSNSVRVELQADCLAGSWVANATNQKDNNGVTFLEPFTQDQYADVVNATRSVGDDHIQSQSGFVNPESFTHGSSEQRVRWFENGLKGGISACNTFNTNDL